MVISIRERQMTGPVSRQADVEDGVKELYSTELVGIVQYSEWQQEIMLSSKAKPTSVKWERSTLL